MIGARAVRKTRVSSREVGSLGALGRGGRDVTRMFVITFIILAGFLCPHGAVAACEKGRSTPKVSLLPCHLWEGLAGRLEFGGHPHFVPQLFGKHSNGSKEMT